MERLREELVKFLIYWCGTDPVDKERCERVINKYLETMKREDYHTILGKYYKSELNSDGMSYSDEISAMMEAAKIQAIEFADFINTELIGNAKNCWSNDQKLTTEMLYNMFIQEQNNQCPNCGSKETIAWGPNQNKCTNCELTWNV